MAQGRTATAKVVQMSDNNRTVVDTAGRKLTIRKLDLLDDMNVLSLVDAADTEKLTYMVVASVIYSITHIDDIPVPEITSKAAFDAMLRKVDKHGLKALLPAYAELAKDDAEQAFETAKNL